jgi:hypothetical protein
MVWNFDNLEIVKIWWKKKWKFIAQRKFQYRENSSYQINQFTNESYELWTKNVYKKSS